MNPMTLVEKPCLEAITHVCRNLRVLDREEIFATRFDDDAERLAVEIWQARNALMYCAFDPYGIPFALGGAMPMWRGVWSLWMFGTDTIQHHGLQLTRHVKTAILPAVMADGFHRGEARSLATHKQAHAWIESCGGELECVQRGLGKNGEDFHLYRWGESHVLQA